MTPERRFFYLSLTETVTAIACLPAYTLLTASQNEWQLPDPNSDAGFMTFLILLVLVMSLALMVRNTMNAWDRATESDMKEGKR